MKGVLGLILVFMYISALSELFEKADVTKDGSITVHELHALCEEHGAKLTDDDLQQFYKRADENGEVLFEFLKSLLNILFLIDFQRRFHHFNQEF